MKKIINHKKTAVEAIIMLMMAFLWKMCMYLGARWIAGSWIHYDLTTAIDGQIPFLPWTVAIYFGCYAFWFINYCLCAAQKSEARNRFFCADILAKTVCFFLFLLIPTTNIRPEVPGNTVWEHLMRFLYRIDAADNLFPSIHCLVSWFCWIGVRRRKEIPFAYRWFSFAAAAAVCLSTLTTRQHVIADVAGGILLAEACYFIAGYSKISAMYSQIVSRFTQWFIKYRYLRTITK